MSITKCLVLALSVVASVNALATPHAARNSVHHRSLAARVAEPRSVNTAPLANIAARAPRSSRKRCRNRPTASSSTPAPTSSSVAVPVNPAPIPTSSVEAEPKPTPSSTRAPAPQPTSSKEEPAPSPTPTPKPSSTTKAAPAPTSGGGGGGSAPNGFMAGVQTGEATYYDAGLGACGWTNGDDDNIVAVSRKLFDSYPGYNGANPNNNPLCGKKIRAWKGDKSLIVTVVDRCEACQMGDLDFTNGGFDRLTGNRRDLGRTQFQWQWA